MKLGVTLESLGLPFRRGLAEARRLGLAGVQVDAAGALIAEVVFNSDASVDYYLAAGARDLITAFPYATGAAVLWIDP